MNFFRLLQRFVPPYRGKVVLNILFNLLSTVLSLFSFAAIIPVLHILFGIERVAQDYVPVVWADGLNAVVDALKNNLFCWLGEQIAAGGAGWVLFLLGLFLVVMTGLKCLCAYMASFFMIPIRTGVLRDLRQQLYNKVLSLPMGYFTEAKKGDVMSRMTSDVNEVEASIMASLDMLFKDPIMIVIYLVMLFCLSWELTLFVLILLPTVGWLIGRIGRSLKKRSTKGQEQTAELLVQIEETLGGLRVVKAFNAEKKLSARFAELNERTRATFNRIHRKYMLAHPVSEFMGTALIAVLLWYGGGLILSERSGIDAAVFIYYLVIFYSIINPAKDLTKAAYSVRKGMASLERIDAILNTVSTIQDPANPIDKSSINCPLSILYPQGVRSLRVVNCPFVEYRDVSFSYQPEVPVLKHINLQIQQGKTIAFVGQSGSGKTTLVDLLPRFYDVTDGAILIGGQDVRTMRLRDLRSLMGIVNQDAILFNDTIWNNITFGVEHATEAEVRQAARIANALDFIEATPDGFQTIVGDRGSRLSGGQRQRISIARAILKNPEILILDEATSALDTESEKLVQEALDHLVASRTTLVVAHRLSTIRNADLICVLNEGEIVETGRHEQLLAKGGYYAKLIEMQNSK
ncbi:MAG: ABC transporter ATP-binding protein [Paludibacteraceae bacterium]|nr:ABC transporter ATP-binding protein [Paludibacteraceae bacterium]